MTQIFTQKKEIQAWLFSMLPEFEKATKLFDITPEGVVNIYTNVNLSHAQLTHLPIQFGYVLGSFDVSHNKLTTLKGAPSQVGISFNCSDNELTDLIGGPTMVSKEYICRHNQLTTLEGISQKMNRLDASYNQLTDLNHLPKDILDDCVLTFNPLSNLSEINSLIGGFLYLDKSQDISIEWLRDTFDSCGTGLVLFFLEQEKVEGLGLSFEINDPQYGKRFASHVMVKNKNEIFEKMQIFLEQKQLDKALQKNLPHPKQIQKI
jgi:hypothetical protein